MVRRRLQSRLVLLSLLACCLATTLRGSSLQVGASPGSAEPTFQVVSIKLSSRTSIPRDVFWAGCHGTDSRYPEFGDRPALGRCAFKSASLWVLINWAYGHGDEAPIKGVEGGPDWITSQHFDLEAGAFNPAHATEKELILMLRQFLASRFKLAFHKQSIEVSGVALTVGSDGPKLSPGLDGEHPFPRSAAGKYQMFSMQDFASRLAFQLEVPVLDKTGLSGRYDFPFSTSSTDRLRVTNALQELGLDLVPQTIVSSVIVVDRAEKPALR